MCGNLQRHMLACALVRARCQVQEPWVGYREGGQVTFGPLLCSPLASLSHLSPSALHAQDGVPAVLSFPVACHVSSSLSWCKEQSWRGRLAKKTGKRFPQMMVTRQVQPAAPPRQWSGLGFCVAGVENLTGGNNGVFILSSSRTSSVVALLASPMGERSPGSSDGGQSLLLCLLPLALQAHTEAGFSPQRRALLEMGIRAGKFAAAVALGPWGPV